MPRRPSRAKSRPGKSAKPTTSHRLKLGFGDAVESVTVDVPEGEAKPWDASTRLTVVGALYLTLVCLMPEFIIAQSSIPFYIGGTSLLIVVSVTMDTVSQVQSHLLAHQYEGLIKKTKLRGRKK